MAGRNFSLYEFSTNSRFKCYFITLDKNLKSHQYKQFSMDVQDLIEEAEISQLNVKVMNCVFQLRSFSFLFLLLKMLYVKV